MKKILFFTLCLIPLISFSQIDYEEGYFINNDNNKISCFIKNSDWKNTPTSINYKLKENGETIEAGINKIKEFFIYPSVKYTKSTVNIDKTGNKINQVSDTKFPSFKQQTLFLKVLIESEISLYQYKENNVNVFFYKKKGKDIEQLVFKYYLVNNKLAKNNMFRQQLFKHLKCTDISDNSLKKVEYRKSELEKLLLKYNKCKNNEVTQYNINKKDKSFNLNLKLGFTNSSLKAQSNSINNKDLVVDFGSKTNLSFGLEIEYIFPFIKNKFSFFAEPTYKNFSEESVIPEYRTTTSSINNINTKINYQFIEIPVGFRYYFYLNDDSKFFINIARNLHFDFNSKIEFDKISSDSDVVRVTSNTLGFGYKYDKKYSIELRYTTDKEITPRQDWDSTFSSIAVILGYTLF